MLKTGIVFATVKTLRYCNDIPKGNNIMSTPKTLLTIDTNAKTVKGQKYGYMTGIVYLAPYNISGNNVCPMASIAQCDKACLYSAGRGAFNNVQQSRINKTKYFYDDRQSFMLQLVRDITKLVAKAKKLDMIPLVRLNGTSDIKWENVTFDYNNDTVTIFDVFPDVQFYDYTKIANRTDLPKNYDLTFSYSGVIAYQKYVNIAIANGMRIAAVFRKRENIPSTFMGLECIDGDDSDIRHIDPKGVIVALYAKGKAKTDTTGFVIDAPRKVFTLMQA
jgi:hypothetical protein